MLLSELNITKEIHQIALTNKLDTTEMYLLACIKGLDKGDGCTALNKYFVTFLKENEPKIKRSLAKLKKKELIRVENAKSWKRKIYYIANNSMEQPKKEDEATVVEDKAINSETKPLSPSEKLQQELAKHKVVKRETKQSTVHRQQEDKQIGHISKKAQEWGTIDSREWDFDNIEMLEREYIERKLQDIEQSKQN